MMTREQENDFILPDGESCWITAGKYSVHVVNNVRDDGLLRVETYSFRNEMDDPLEQYVLDLY